MIRRLISKQKGQRSNRRQTTFRPALDKLEPRNLMAANLGFTPLSSSAMLLPTGDPGEAQPFDLAAGYEQEIVNNRAGDPDVLALLDMNTLNETGPEAGRYLFTASETGSNAGVNRTDLATGDTVILAQRADFNRFDGIRWTPWGTVLVNEETAPGANADGLPAVNGLVYEILNPLADPGSVQIVARPGLGSQAHEGIAIDEDGNVYGIDELNGGAIYKFTPANFGDLSSGQLFALADVAPGDGIDLGAAVWTPLTDAAGNPLPGITDPKIDGRTAANDVGATDYLRPEDLEIGRLANGNQVLYVATTTDDRVLSIELAGNPIVREYVTDATIDVATGLPVDNSGDTLTSPDNLAIDDQGRLYIIEDNNAGDLWGSFDVDGDGVAEGIGRLASLRVNGAEPTGMYFNPFDPAEIFVNVQHPASGNDAIVAIRLADPEASALLVNGVLSVNGTNESDAIAIDQHRKRLRVYVNGHLLGSFDSRDVDSLRVNAKDDNDFVGIDDKIGQNALIFGGGGNDWIVAGKGDDVISGGEGNDLIFAGKGDDRVFGNAGLDILFGEIGRDVLDGGDDFDILVGGSGHDLFENGEWIFS